MRYVIKQGDTLTSVAFRFGFLPDTLWNHGDNQPLKEKRADHQLLFPGDEIVIPELETREEAVPAEQKHTFRRKAVPSRLRVRLLDERDEPRTEEAYQLLVAGSASEGVTDGDGWIEESIPPDAESAKLLLDSTGEEFELFIGELDPEDEVSGGQARLINLGFSPGQMDGVAAALTEEAILDFQATYEIERTGELDDVTIAKLVELHQS